MSDTPSISTMHMERWLKASEGVAAQIVECQVTLREARQALRFYFLRKAIAMNGGVILRASNALGIHRGTLCRSMRFRASHMAPSTRALAEHWATWLASEGATLEEADRVFAGSLVRAARAACKDNQCKAAQLLRTHRNSVRRLEAAVAGAQVEGAA